MSIRPSKKRSSRRQLRFELLASRVLMAADLQWNLTPNLETVVDTHKQAQYADTQAGDKSSRESSERKEDRDREPQNDRQQRRDPADLNRRSDARGRDEKSLTGDRLERFGKANETGRGVQSRERNSKQDQNRERQTTNPRAQGGSSNDEKSKAADELQRLLFDLGMESNTITEDKNEGIWITVDRTEVDQHYTSSITNPSNEDLEWELAALGDDVEIRINDDRPTPESESDAIDPDDDIQWAWDDDDDSTPNPTQDTPKGDMIATLLGDHGVTPYSKLANTIRGVYSPLLRNDPLIDPGHPTVGAVHRQQQDVGQIEELPHNYGLIDPDPRDEEHQRQEPQEGQDAEKNLDPWINPKRPGNDSPKGENGGKEGGKPPSREKAPRDKGQERR